MKKILIFSLAYYPSHVSGAEAAIKEITDRIDDIEFHMITLHFDSAQQREEKVGNVFVHRVGVGPFYISKILFIPLAAFVGFKLHQKHNFSALWALMSYMLLPIVLMRGLGARIPYVLTIQEGDTYEHMFERWFIRPIMPLIRSGFKNTSFVQAISSFLAAWAPRLGYTGEVQLIHNGANPKNLSEDYSREEANVLKEKLGKKDGDIFLLNAARLVHQKGHDDVIRALKLLPENVKFILIGSGPDEEMLKQVAKDEGVRERVMFIGQLTRDEVPLYRNKIVSDIFVGPSRSEGLGNSFLSAMAARLPVITTQEGGLAEFVFDAKRNPDKQTTAWAVDKDNHEQIAEAVKDIIGNPEKVKEVTDRSRKMVEEDYNWDVIAKKMRGQIFGKIL